MAHFNLVLGASLYPSTVELLAQVRSRVRPVPTNQSALVRGLIRVGHATSRGVDAARGKSGERAGMVNSTVKPEDFARLDALAVQHGLNRSRMLAALIESAHRHYFPEVYPHNGMSDAEMDKLMTKAMNV